MPNGAAWGTCGVKSETTACSLSDVMSEQLAVQLQREEDAFAERRREESISASVAEGELLRSLSLNESTNDNEIDTSKDLEIARMLQEMYNAELESAKPASKPGKKMEKPKGKEKEKILLNIFTTDEPAVNGGPRRGQDDADEADEEDEDDGQPEWKRGPAFSCSSKGYSGRGQNIRTKHDLEVASRRNADRIMDCLDPTFNSGDVVVGEHQIGDAVYNSLRQISCNSDHRRTVRLQEKKDHSTAISAVDKKTREILYHMVTQDRLCELGGVIATGKESVVFFSRAGDKLKDSCSDFTECAVKVFKTTLNEFKSRGVYVSGDFRFVKDEFKKLNPRKIIKMWAQKEMVNLKKIYKAGLPCPKPILLNKHVLVMSHIGDNGRAADQLSEADLPPEDWEDAYDQTVKIIRRLYDECSLVHADLSGYNLLWHRDSVWVIDVSQSVDKEHPHALSFLRRDCENVTRFFNKKGVHEVAAWEDLFNSLTGLSIAGHGDEFMKNFAAYLSATQEYEASEHYLTEGVHRREFPFDYFFERTQRTAGATAAYDDDEEEESTESEEESSSQFVNQSTQGKRE